MAEYVDLEFDKDVLRQETAANEIALKYRACALWRCSSEHMTSANISIWSEKKKWNHRAAIH